ncbi:MAG: HAD family phosphatase [Acidimicrobiaceae bacterium]|nr:HAD family phosphatase [Acidimicrobiaceae bacterium]
MDAVVFDLDGTLIDSEPLWEQVRRRLVVDHGGHWPEDAQARMMGMRTAEWATYLHDDLDVAVPPAQIADEAIAAMRDLYHQHLPLLPGAVAAVDRLAERWRLGLASSSPRPLVDTALDLSGLAQRFAAVVSTDEVAAGKPAPDVYRLAVDRLGAEPTRCVAVEDSTNGVRSAVAAGLACIAVPRAQFPVDPATLAKAAAVLPELGRLTPALVESL